MSKPKTIENPHQGNSPYTRLLTIKDVAQRLQLSPRTIHRLIDSEAIKVKRIGRSVRISEQALSAFLQRSDST